VFNLATRGVNRSSAPGYPFQRFASNSDVLDLAYYELYLEVNSVMQYWLNTGLPAGVPTDEVCVNLLLNRCVPPCTLFVKGEPTDKDKVARLIYGMSLVTNVISRILFGDWIGALKSTWVTNNHKVGMDMYTTEGLDALFTSAIDLFNTSYPVVSDDIQGYEYQTRFWMTQDFLLEYLRAADATPFQHHMVVQYLRAERHMLVLDSDYCFHRIHFYIRYSGTLLTHAANSFERAALADMDFNTIGDGPSSMTNGDDCVARSDGTPIEDLVTTRLGFVHKYVVAQSRDRLNFCSQLFLEEKNGYKRVPDGLSKLLANFLCASCPIARADILSHVAGEPKIYYAFHLIERAYLCG